MTWSSTPRKVPPFFDFSSLISEGLGKQREGRGLISLGPGGVVRVTSTKMIHNLEQSKVCSKVEELEVTLQDLRAAAGVLS